jgi:protein-disulfide isomerase
MSREIKILYITVFLLFASVVTLCFGVCRLYRQGNSSIFNEKISLWITNNPKAIIDSVNQYAEKQQSEQREKHMDEVSENIKKNREVIFDEKSAGVHNPGGQKTIVIFFDYNCGHCKNASRAIDNVVKNDPNVRVIFKDLPIFGGASTLAAKYSVAVSMVEGRKFLDFHRALMNGSARDEKTIEDALVVAKISVEKIRKILSSKSKEIDARLEDNMKLAGALGIEGTPAMIVGEQFIPGYINADKMRNILK